MNKEPELLGNYRAQFVGDSGRLWVTKDYEVYSSEDCGNSFTFRARLETRWLRNLLTKWALSSRLIRGGFLHLHPLPDGSLLGVVYGAIVRCEPGSDLFLPVLERPGRTMKIEVLPGGTIFAGEYFFNMHRGPVSVLRSDDEGRTWVDAHRFKPGDIRHIHSITYDPRVKSLIILTGDKDAESKILLTKDMFQTIRVLSEGTQRSRAIAVLPAEGGYFVATDTQHEQNYIQFLTFEGDLSILHPIVGSCFGGCQVGEWSFFATAAEPSKVNNDPSVTIYGARNGRDWHVVHRWRVDLWSWPTVLQAALFQMGRVIFPAGENLTRALFVTPVAVKNGDAILHRWMLPIGDGNSPV